MNTSWWNLLVKSSIMPYWNQDIVGKIMPGWRYFSSLVMPDWIETVSSLSLYRINIYTDVQNIWDVFDITFTYRTCYIVCALQLTAWHNKENLKPSKWYGFNYNSDCSSPPTRLGQRRNCFSARGTRGRGIFNKFLYGEAPPGGPTPYPFIYTIFHEKVPLSHSFYWQMVILLHTLFRTLHFFELL